MCKAAEAQKSKCKLDAYWSDRLNAKASATADITSSSVATSSDEYLILFPKAFLRPSELPRAVTHEISHFLIEEEWGGHFREYKRISGWNSVKGDRKYRDPGDFVDFDGKFSPEEDFANNIEFYLFEPALKSKSPRLFDWIDSRLGAVLRLERECINGKK